MSSTRMKWLPEYGLWVFSDGRVAKTLYGKFVFLNGSKSSKGYWGVNIKKKHLLLHRLVATAFISNPEGKPTVDHIDRNKDNNSVDNLRWATMEEQCYNRESTLKLLARLGIRSVGDTEKEYSKLHEREYRGLHPDIRAKNYKDYRERKKASGCIQHKCSDGKRRWHKPNHCPCCIDSHSH